jgi:heme-degrading monooxygenase HmoA
MITALVQFNLSTPLTGSEVKEDFSNLAPRLREVPGLIRKYFLLSEDGRTAGGVYIWESKAAAERLYTDDFKKSIVQRYGSEPSVTYFESPVVVDNLVGEIIKDW